MNGLQRRGPHYPRRPHQPMWMNPSHKIPYMTWKAKNLEDSPHSCNKLNTAWPLCLRKVDGVECKLQSLFNAGVHDSKEQASKMPAEGPCWSSPDMPVG